MYLTPKQKRIRNALHDRLLLVDITNQPTLGQIIVNVLGTTHNVYDVTFKDTCSPTCTCPDYVRRKISCKHILFVVLRILKCDDNEQHTLENYDRVSELLAQRESSDVLVVDDMLCAKYRSLKLNPQQSSIKEEPRNEECGFCLESLTDNFGLCPYCRTGWHDICWNRWQTVSTNPKCIICRKSVPSNDKEKSQYIVL